MSHTTHWSDLKLPKQRTEAWYGDRMVPCFTPRPTSLLSMLTHSVQTHGSHDAVVFEDQRWSYTATWQEVQRMARVLHARHIQAGDRVLLFMRNRPEFVFTLYALQYLGAIAVPVGVREQRPGLAYIATQCQAKAVVFDADLNERIPDTHEAPALAQRLCIEQMSDASGTTLPEPHIAHESEVAVILYTSGTTGNPKGAMLTHTNIAHSVMHFEHGMGLSSTDRSALAVPASHVTGLVAIIATLVYLGGTVLILREFKAATFLAACEAERISHTLMVPAMYSLCLMEPSFATRQLSHWRVGGYGGAPMPVAVIDQLASYLPGLGLFNAYGATETTSPTTLMPAGCTREHADTVGVALPCADIRVMDDEGCEVPTGETGELWIAGPMVVPGYWDNPQATAQAFTAGYWHSGDLGSIDAQGFVRIYDRKKDMLNRGGFKIYSVEVENCLMAFAGVLEAAIVGKPCPVLGERVHAFIYAPQHHLETDALIRHCQAALADYKVPESITFMETPLPRNANGKVLKRQLRALIA